MPNYTWLSYKDGFLHGSNTMLQLEMETTLCYMFYMFSYVCCKFGIVSLCFVICKKSIPSTNVYINSLKTVFECVRCIDEFVRKTAINCYNG